MPDPKEPAPPQTPSAPPPDEPPPFEPMLELIGDAERAQNQPGKR